MSSHKNSYSALLKERYLLSRPGSEKETWHLVLDIKNLPLTYKVGDSVAVFVEHDPKLVDKTLEALQLTGEESVFCKRTKERFSLRHYLTSKANITHLHANLFPSLPKGLLSTYELWDFALSHPLFRPTAQELADLLPPLLPRFYSIASAQELSPHEIHLTVVMTEYETRGHKRFGVASHFLCHVLKRGCALSVALQPSKDFTLPNHPEADLIMIGPGTGVAPFRGFMQKRLHENHTGQNWLFFGDQRRSCDFLYEEFWTDLESRGLLNLSLAFSRDQESRIYVQHRMLEEGKRLWDWLENGAFLFVCGDAANMAKDVEKTLLEIAALHGLHSEETSRKFLKELRSEKRYLRDVY